MKTGRTPGSFRFIHGAAAVFIAFIVLNQYRLWRKLQNAQLIVRGYWEALHD